MACSGGPLRYATSVVTGLGLATSLAGACASEEPIDQGSAGSGGSAAGGTGPGGVGGTSLLPDVLTDQNSDTVIIDPDSACETTSEEAQFVPANILFVVDKSGSMSCNAPPVQSTMDCDMNPVRADPGQPSKWEITRDALKTAIAGMPGSSSVGIAYFPKGSVCDKPIQPDVPIANLTAGHRNQLDASLDSVAPVGATPLVGSMLNGYIYLNTETLTGNVFVILITDGAESCGGDPNMLITTVGNEATAKNVRTFVIGAPGSDSFRSVLSDVAFAGGTAANAGCDHGNAQPDIGDCHFDMTSVGDFSQALNDALDTISGNALTCEFPIPDRLPNGDPVNYEKVNVRYTPGNGDPETILPFAPSGDCEGDNAVDGWQYSADMMSILLCGSTCETVTGDPTATVNIVFGCDRITK